jgi:virE N-domain protein
MISCGKNIPSAADPLLKIKEEQLYHSLINPRPDIEARIRQLRIVYAMDTKQYASLKRTLPYVVCGHFTPNFRKKENFAYTETFILDIDHVSEKNLDLAAVRQQIQADTRVLLCFASPGEDGLKVMFRLSERCYDPGIYTLFYKAFARDFSLRYHLEQAIDNKTSDVARACFISVDRNAYFNPQCEPVDIKTFVNPDNPLNVADTRHELEQHQKMQKETFAASPEPRLKDPDAEVLQRIKQQLNKDKAIPKPAPEAFVPERLNELVEPLKQHIQQTGLVVTEIANIQYAKKIKVRMGQKDAEVNLFYGKRGFSVVISPRRGTNEELNEVVAKLIEQFVNQ